MRSSCRGYTRFTYDGIQMASGSLKREPEMIFTDPPCSRCYRADADYLCSECHRFICAECGVVIGGTGPVCVQCVPDESSAGGSN